MIRFYKDGDRMGIATDHIDGSEFLADVSRAISDMIDNRTFDGDWDFQLRFWLGHIVEICCKLRGYKADVQEQRMISVGSIGTTPLIAEIDNRENVKIYEGPRYDEIQAEESQ